MSMLVSKKYRSWSRRRSIRRSTALRTAVKPLLTSSMFQYPQASLLAKDRKPLPMRRARGMLGSERTSTKRFPFA